MQATCNHSWHIAAMNKISVLLIISSSHFVLCVVCFQLESQLPEENNSSLLHTKESVSIYIMEPQFRPHSVDSLD